jgi:cellulose synthase (UDP-forming)
MNFRNTPIQPPGKKEKIALRAMIFIGYFSVAFFLYNMFKGTNIGNKPLYILLMITLVYTCLKYMHEWYHYFAISVTPRPEPKRMYTIDVFTTYCAGEPFDMLEQTLTAMQAMTYPHTSYCCDEADDPDVRALCAKLDVKHITRTIKVNAKAGNINNALKQSSGELCVVMDPDHIPASGFLDEVIGYFEDEKVGYVQIVQAYYNQGESLVAKGAAQQTYQFYGPMMMCMNTYGTVQAIGANCTFRRTALESIGGHAAGLSEDMHTAMQMHAKGWKSIYHPAILTRGLVTATMSSYFKQQLKWSRGTWDLLLFTYPKLFSKFTWKQRLHYFLLPFHYLSGLIFFLNFLIPVISLFTGHIPLKMDVIAFALAAFPVLAMSVLIRHFVQKWVAEENERGFHIVGGILQIGAWWVHSIGFFYTLIRKKVPYIPTPKNDNDPLPFVLSVPNLTLATISLTAIVYGFTSNYNPYTTFMAALAFLQVLFMLFIFAISGYASDESRASNFAMKIRKQTGWIVATHGFLRKYSVILSVLVVSVFIWGYKTMNKLPTFLPKPLPGLEVFYKGVARPAGDTTYIEEIFKRNNSTSIIALNINNDRNSDINLLEDKMSLIYKHNALPLINWKPFENNNVVGAVDDKLMQQISAGKFDSTLILFANRLGALKKPFFLNASFSKSPTDTLNKLQPQYYVEAWKHLHNVFTAAGVEKVIWVWTNWDIATAPSYFPGSAYTDWLGVNIYDNQTETNTTDKQGFYSQYHLYHKMALFNYGLPVMVTQAGTAAKNKTVWYEAAAANIDTTFKEIKAIVVTNEKGVDQSNVLTAIATNNFEKDIKGLAAAPAKPLSTKQYTLPDTLKGVVYDKGYFWFRNRHTMTKRSLEADVKAMKAIGANTIERSMPGFYDGILDELFRKYEMKQIGRFVTLIGTDELDDDKKMQQEKEKILAVVKENLSRQNIIAWNLGADVLFNLENQTYKPGIYYYRNKYVNWLSDVCNAIRALDKVRPIVSDLNWDVNGKKRIQFYKQHVPQIDKYMLVATTKNKPGLKEPLDDKMAWGKVPVELWDSLPAVTKSAFVPAWQDIENTDYITLNGIIDLNGRNKQWHRKVEDSWSGHSIALSPVPDIKILKPSKTTRESTTLTYNIMYRQDTTQWKLYRNQIKDLKFEWYLVRVDQYANTMFIKKVGEGSTLSLPIPQGPQYYELFVEAVIGKDVKTARSTLNTPLE